MSLTASASASLTESRSGEAAGQAQQAAILETGTGRGLWALACEGRGAALGTAPAVSSPGRPVRLSARPGVRGSELLVPPSEAHGFSGQAGRGQHTPNPSPLARRGGGGGKQARAQPPGLMMAAQASRRQ